MLLVEDEESIVEFVRLGLTYEGFDVEVARSGTDAIDALHVHEFDLAVLDLTLPGA